MEDFFGPEGIFKRRLPGFEYRRQQEELAGRIDSFLHGEGSLLAAEAPTGVGKTFAMLVPAMLWAKEENKSVLVLTSGITLQEQLINKDIPALLDVLGLDLPFSLLKGRGNYACVRLAKEIASEGFLDFGGDKGSASRDISEWLYDTDSGDLGELGLPDDHPARARIASSFRTCQGRFCPYHDVCFYNKALRDAVQSRVVVANYHLFFSYVLGQRKPFPVPFGLLLCDEAHKMADAARSATQVSVGAADLQRLLRRPPGVERLDASALDGAGFGNGAFGAKLSALALSGENAFEEFERVLPEGRGFSEFPEELRGGTLAFLSQCDSMLEGLKSLEGVGARDLQQDDEPLEGSLAAWGRQLSDCREALRWCCDAGDYPRWAYWRDGSSLKSACVSCSGIIPSAFEGGDEAVKAVALSATMTVDGSFDFWSEETGLVPDETVVLDSPFDLRGQMRLCVVDLGASVRDDDYPDIVARVCRKFSAGNGGATLVLLSSRRVLRVVSEYMKGFAERDGLNVLAQGDLPRGELLRLFRENKGSVLIGLASFREGVDVPGDALTQVIIDKLPFSHPGDPVGEARVALEGRSAFFMKVALPGAKMQLRQSVGRLIRSGTDKGRVVILDERVLSKRGWNVLASLPDVPCARFNVTGWKKRC